MQRREPARFRVVIIIVRPCNTGHGQHHCGGYYEFPNVPFHTALLLAGDRLARFAGTPIKPCSTAGAL
jgi:hypothetical protein